MNSYTGQQEKKDAHMTWQDWFVISMGTPHASIHAKDWTVEILGKKEEQILRKEKKTKRIITNEELLTKYLNNKYSFYR